MIALEPGQQWLSQFQLLKELVPRSEKRPNIWLAAKEGSGEKVVLKFLRPGPPSPLLVRRLADWRATRLPQFMPLVGVHMAGDQMALELPYVAEDNASLRGASYVKWSVWLEQVIETVQALHRDNFIHGDIKLGNIRRDGNGRPVLSDPWLPGDGKSPYTASPERLSGGPISIHDDLYAIGALLHELSTGYPPRYPGLDPSKPPKPRFEMPAEAVEAMHGLLQAVPVRRPSLADVLATLAPLNVTHPQAGDTVARKSASLQRPAPTPPPTAAPASPPVARVAPPRAPVAAVLSPAKPSTPGPRAVVTPIPPGLIPPPVAVPATPARPAAANDAAPTFAAASLAIRPPEDAPFQPVPLQVGSPSWMRPAAAISAHSPSPFQSRASVWRWPVLLLLLGGAIAAFVWLPEEVRQSAVEQVTAMAARTGLMPAAAPSVAQTPADLRGLAEQKLQAEQSRDQAATLESKLRDNGAAARSIPTFIAGVDANKLGLTAFERRNFAAADEDFKTALKAFEATRQSLPQWHEQALAAGDAALAQCLTEQALNEYRYALALMPQDARAKEGIARAQVCEQVFAHLSAGAKAEQSGDAEGAKSEYQAAVQLDPKSAAAKQALGTLTGQASEVEFSKQIAAGLESLRKHRYSAAATAIAAAEKLRPGSPEAQRLSEQLGEVHSNERLQALKSEAADDEREEHWSEALDAYHAMLAVDGTLVLAIQGAQRSDERMKLDAELAGYIDSPDRLSAEEVRNAASTALARGQVLPARGPRIETQISRIKVLLSQFDARVSIALRSDGFTDVTIYRVGGLGKFSQRSVSLKPGKYVFVGSRLGYRDVRREFEVVPGQESATLEIRCEEQI